MDELIENYVTGIAKASFCKPNINQKYISFAHFLSLQPRECLKVRDEYYPDMMIWEGKLYIWLPTPPKKMSDQGKYSAECRKRLAEVIREGTPFSEILLDVRGNIGGVLSTVVNAVYPIFAPRINGTYLYGINKKGETVTKFEIVNQENNKITHYIRTSTGPIKAEIMPIDESLIGKFDSKPISILCNRYTMSTGEIMCIIVRKFGGTIYGEHTRGLTNGMESISTADVKSVLIP